LWLCRINHVGYRLLPLRWYHLLATDADCAMVCNRWLILARGVQGIGGGGLLSLWQAILGNLVAVKERGTYQTWFSISWGLAWYVCAFLHHLTHWII
jgi:MFS family permease